MSFDSLMSRPCSIIPRTTTGTDRYNNPVQVDGDPVETFCYRQQSQATEQTVERTTEAETWLYVLPADTVIDGDSAILDDGETFEVDGPPWPVWNPRTASVGYIECKARRVE